MAPALPKKDKNPDSLKFALSFFSSDKAIHFDALYPVYVPSDEREFEPEFGSSRDVDDFVAALPVEQMVEINSQFSRFLTPTHEYYWMMQWLGVSMEISEISCELLQARVKYLDRRLEIEREKLNEHKARHASMLCNDNCDEEAILMHGHAGFQAEKKASFMLFLVKAVEQKCAYYRSPEGKSSSKALDKEWDTLTPKKFHGHTFPDRYLD
ncbi:hypothetical protein PF010_g26262 [Phytophthora fragariae]|nr:hypothetical protein PF003_g35057 [Phytophthora fragariae]KAE8921973.1 hypothetical protein PF009_g27752 [Phytophthora fragariae]KAE9070459.1 hypothetical protein PF010_g26262 [Phytophthora fragariae]KAE9074178.1 hypothetical protein PF007_g25515 [Phytophthora fragariae]KAE9086359.1 hypothetical protein PF006_g26044 [Phytophthora fragariae]